VEKARVAQPLRLRATTDPFLLARATDAKLERLGRQPQETAWVLGPEIK
jgi:hypothetical protein